MKFDVDNHWGVSSNDGNVHYLIRWLCEDAVRINGGFVGGWGGRISLRVRGGRWREFEGFVAAVSKGVKRGAVLRAKGAGGRLKGRDVGRGKIGESKLGKLGVNGVGVEVVGSQRFEREENGDGEEGSPKVCGSPRVEGNEDVSGGGWSPVSVPGASPRRWEGSVSPDFREKEICLPIPLSPRNCGTEAASPLLLGRNGKGMSQQDMSLESPRGDGEENGSQHVDGEDKKVECPQADLITVGCKRDAEGSPICFSSQSKPPRTARTSNRLAAREPKSFATTPRLELDSGGPCGLYIEFPSPDNPNLFSRAHCRVQKTLRKCLEEKDTTWRTSKKFVNTIEVIGHDVCFLKIPESPGNGKRNELKEDAANLREELNAVQSENEPLRERLRKLATQELDRQREESALVEEEARIHARLKQLRYNRAKKEKAALMGADPRDLDKKDNVRS